MYFDELPAHHEWINLNKAIHGDVPYTIEYDLARSFCYENGELTIIWYDVTVLIPLSGKNKYILDQIEELTRCTKNNIEYAWVDLPVSVKSARKINE